MTRRDSGFDREAVATTTTKGQDNMDKFQEMKKEAVTHVSIPCGGLEVARV